MCNIVYSASQDGRMPNSLGIHAADISPQKSTNFVIRAAMPGEDEIVADNNFTRNGF